MGADFFVNGVLLPDVRLCVFDKDGTIIDVHTYWANMIRFRAEFIEKELGLDEMTKKGLMESMGVHADRMHIKPDGPVGLKKREIVLQSGLDYLAAKGYQNLRNVFLKTFKEVDDYSLGKFQQIVKPLQGVVELFARLKLSGCLISIATTDIQERAIKVMDHLGLLCYIDEIAGADAVKKPKPDPEIIFSICAKLSVDVRRTVMIGDAESDIRTGLNAGCMASIGVESGFTSRDKLLALTPLVVPDLQKILIEEGVE